MDKIAFMFLLYDKIQHQKLWEDFFSGDPLREKYSIYSHPKVINEKTPQWIIDNCVRTVKTDWCSENLVKALCQMLKKALKDKNNTHFAFLSGTCIPLYDFQKTYKKIVKEKKTRMNYFKSLLFGNKKEDYIASQWLILNRKVAKDLIKLFNPKNKSAKKFIKTQRKRYKDHGVKIKNKTYTFHDFKGDDKEWHGGCPDEVFPIEWFIKLYGKPSSQRFKKNIKFQETTWILWDSTFTHPYIINKTQLKKYKKNMCTSNSIFARKFNKTTAKMIGMQC